MCAYGSSYLTRARPRRLLRRPARDRRRLLRPLAWMIALPRHVDDTWTVARTGRRIVSLLTACKKKRDGKRYPATGKVATGRFRGRSRPQAARRSQSHRLQLPVNIGRRRDRRKGPEKRESGHFLKRDETLEITQPLT